jgi:hypothetical protein
MEGSQNMAARSASAGPRRAPIEACLARKPKVGTAHARMRGGFRVVFQSELVLQSSNEMRGQTARRPRKMCDYPPPLFAGEDK